ncbi:hypothetical protein [Salinarimonas sp.]|uniref:hypothetical protein n=1 Tax=Salinarimonas sp. TaxID=2766526 RepID=UPI00391DBB8D
MKYRIASHVVIREDEGVAFDSQRFVVHKLNETAMRIVAEIVAEAKSVDALSSALPDIPQDDVGEFLAAAASAGFVSAQDDGADGGEGAAAAR